MRDQGIKASAIDTTLPDLINDVLKEVASYEIQLPVNLTASLYLSVTEFFLEFEVIKKNVNTIIVQASWKNGNLEKWI